MTKTRTETTIPIYADAIRCTVRTQLSFWERVRVLLHGRINISVRVNYTQLLRATALCYTAAHELELELDEVDVQAAPDGDGVRYELRVVGNLAGRVWSEPETAAVEIKIGRCLTGRDTFVLILASARITTPTASAHRRDLTARTADASAVATTAGLMRRADADGPAGVEHIVTGRGPREVLAQLDPIHTRGGADVYLPPVLDVAGETITERDDLPRFNLLGFGRVG